MRDTSSNPASGRAGIGQGVRLRSLAWIAVLGSASLAFSNPAWQRLPSMVAYQLSALMDAGGGRMHGINASGISYTSLDSGQGWIPQGTLPVQGETPTHLVFTSPDTGYAGGNLSSVWRTLDGGRRWEKVFSDFLVPWQRFQFFHGKAGLALNKHFLVRTLDGWVTPVIVRRDVQDLQILDRSSAVILAFDTLYRSMDTGRTWNPLPWTPPGGGKVLNFHFADAGNGGLIVETVRAASENAVYTFYRTRDSGTTWSAVSQGARRPNREPSPPFAEILFRDSLEGISWENFFDTEGLPRFLVHRTGDGGRTWVDATPASPGWGDLSLGPDGDFWMLGRGGALSRSRNAGRSWEEWGGGGTRSYHPAHFQDRMRGVALTGVMEPEFDFVGSLFRTRDGGRTWRMHPGLAGISLWDMHFVDARLGYAAGDSGKVVRTRDGGEVWAAVPFPFRTHLSRVSFCDSANGSVGSSDSIFGTTDAGRTWRLLGPTQDPMAFPACADADGVVPAPGVHYTLGAEGAFKASLDSGRTWELRSYVPGPPWPPTPRSLFLTFQDADTGFVAGDSGLVFGTVDGGRTWNDARIPGRGRLVWLAHASGSPSFAMTSEGDIWEYSATVSAGKPSLPVPAPHPSQPFYIRGGRLVIGMDPPYPLRVEARDARGRIIWSMPRLQGGGRSEFPLPIHHKPYFLVIKGGKIRSVLRVPASLRTP